MSIQKIIVFLAVAVAVIGLVRKLFFVKKGGCGCGEGCRKKPSGGSSLEDVEQRKS